jgi:hypothetical protein
LLDTILELSILNCIIVTMRSDNVVTLGDDEEPAKAFTLTLLCGFVVEWGFLLEAFCKCY